MNTQVKHIEFLAEKVPGHPFRHHMRMTVDGQVVMEGNSLTDLSAKQSVEIFREKFPGVKVTFIDRTVQ